MYYPEKIILLDFGSIREFPDEFIKHYLNNSLHHAYIFSGNKGIGKATLAYLLSRQEKYYPIIKQKN